MNMKRKQARHDFFLVSETIFPYVTGVSVTTGFKSDHHDVLLNFKFNEKERWWGYWKLNNTLLKVEEYITIVKDTLNEIKIHTS